MLPAHPEVYAMTPEEEEGGAEVCRSSAHFCITCLRSPEHTHATGLLDTGIQACSGASFIRPDSCQVHTVSTFLESLVSGYRAHLLNRPSSAPGGGAFLGEVELDTNVI